jgi:DNA ligase-1
MSVVWINKLNESDSRLHKEDVIKQVLTAAILGEYQAEVFLGMAQATYNPMVTWGVKQVPSTEGITGAQNPWQEFNSLLSKLHLRELTGNSARFAIEDMSKRFDSAEWNGFCAAILRKDLRAGISEKTLNKICKGTKWEVPVFSCQLATSCEDRPEMRGLKRLEPKLDGVRVLMVCTASDAGPSVISYSRNGKIFENFTTIEQQLIGVMDRLSVRLGHTSFVLDGEVVGNSFQELMRQARRKENVSADDSVFHVFDIIPLPDFLRGHWNARLQSRLDVLNKASNLISSLPNVELLPHINVDLNTAQGKDQFDRYCKDKVAEGFEGVMIKDLDAPYQCKRTTFWLKYKPVITVDLEVVDVEEGTGRNLGRLGALVCTGFDHGKQITVNVGSGFTDADRDSFWVDRNLVMGRTVEILCDTITKNQDGTYSLRFPRFLRFRSDLD